MKPREPRRSVLINARMRLGADWGDVTICNMSSRGLMGQTTRPPAKGDYIEIRKYSLIVIGRVAWQKGNRFGIRTQDKIDIDNFVHIASQKAPDRPPPHKLQAQAAERRADRDKQVNHAEQLERSRQISSLIQYGVFAFIALGVAILLATTLYEFLSGTTEKITSHL